MSEPTVGKMDPKARQLAERMRGYLRLASSLEGVMEYNDASKEYLKASEAAMALSERYGTTGPYGVGVSGRYKTLSDGYRNMAGVYSGWARDASEKAGRQNE